MNLQKKSWKLTKLDDVCHFVRGPFGGSLKKEIFVESGFAVYEQSHAIYNQFEDVRYFINEDKFNQMKRFQVNAGDLIMSCSGTFGKIAIIPKGILPGVINQALLKLTCKSGLYYKFLAIWMNSDVFQRKINANVYGTAIKNIASISVFKNLEITLPPFEEQQRIVELVTSVDRSVEQCELQEKNLRFLANRLIDGLINENPTFGNLLEGKKLPKVKFAEVTDCIEQHQKETLPLGLTRFVGLENIEPENFRISTWGNVADGTTFTKTFAKGDVLFGKRRAYLKKVAVAEFDGICSSDILVFRAKENKMLADLLPFYAASESFIQYAVNTSAGSLSPRTKWRDLAKFELSVPDLKTQSKILEVLQQIQQTIEQTIEQKQNLKNLKFKLLNEILG